MQAISRFLRRSRLEQPKAQAAMLQKGAEQQMLAPSAVTEDFEDDNDSLAPVPQRSRRSAIDAYKVRGSTDFIPRSSRSSINPFEQNREVGSVKSLHRGRFATVYSAVDQRTGRAIAIKAYRKDRLPNSELMKVHKEVQLVQSLGGFNGVVRVERSWEDSQHVYVATELCTGGTLLESICNHCGKIGEKQVALEIALPLLRTLSALHAKRIVHRDLRPEHVLRHKGELRLIDFHEAAVQGIDHLNYRTGNIHYQAPEVLTKSTAAEVFHQVLMYGMSEEELPSYNEKADLWSLGVILYETITGRQPFQGDTIMEVMRAQTRALSDCLEDGMPVFINQLFVSAECKLFLSLLLNGDPSERPSAQQLMIHPWLSACKAASGYSMERRASVDGRLKRAMTSELGQEKAATWRSSRFMAADEQPFVPTFAVANA